MTDTTANLGLPVIAAAQAQKHVTHNEALRLIDTLLQLAVLDRDLSAPPGSPNDGERWIVGPSPTGAWTGHTDDIAAWQDGAWRFSTPRVGWVAFVADEGALVVWNGSAWGDAAPGITTLQNLALLGVGTTADATNPFSAKLNNALWAAKTAGEGGDGDLRYKMSKESAADTLSLLLQTSFSGRAEIGLIGDDDLSIKVSPDGSSWLTALLVAAATGAVTIQQSSNAAALGVRYSEDGAGRGPLFNLTRTSASPAASDLIGGFEFDGHQADGAAVTYARLGAQIADPSTGAAYGRFNFETRNAGSMATRVYVAQGVVVGNPTGGDKGVGTVNATAVYDDNVLLTCAPVELLTSGRLDLGKWDALAPQREHKAARYFAGMLAQGFDPRDPDSFVARMKADGAVPGLFTEAEWTATAAADGKPSVGDAFGRAQLAIDTLGVAFAGAMERIAALEARLAALERT